VGTFHHDKGELHGITVVVDTTGPEVFVGRCDTMTDTGIVLLDADKHEDGQDGESKKAFVQRVARMGHWSHIPLVAIPRDKIHNVKRLGEVTAEQ
jgi:hypothetical protein